jgi:glutamate synthase (NADPH/NADH)
MLLQEFIDDGKGHVAGIRCVTVNWMKDETGRWKMEEVPDSEKVQCDWVQYCTTYRCRT